MKTLPPRTRSGVAFDYGDPDSYPLDSLELYRTARRIPRWGGRLKLEVSLLDHLALCLVLHDQGAERWPRDQYQLVARYLAAHDLHEVVLLDVPAPLKALLPDYRALEARWAESFHRRLGLTWPVPQKVQDRVKEIDLYAGAVELGNAGEPSDEDASLIKPQIMAGQARWIWVCFAHPRRRWALVAHALCIAEGFRICSTCGVSEKDAPGVLLDDEDGRCSRCQDGVLDALGQVWQRLRRPA